MVGVLGVPETDVWRRREVDAHAKGRATANFDLIASSRDN